MLTQDAEGPFERRKLDPEIAAMYGATFANGVFRFEYRRENGSLAFTKFRSEDKSRMWIEPKGSPLLLQGLEKIPQLERLSGATLVISEGEPDRLAFLQSAGDSREFYVLSLPNGAQKRRDGGAVLVKDDKAFSFLWGVDERLIWQIEQFDRIILATDGDEDGMLCRDELAIRIGPSRCWYLPYPEGAKDANDVLKRWGERGVLRLLEIAKPIRPGMQMSLADVPPPPSTVAYSTGFTFLDRHVQIVRPELMVITGSPGAGKGVFARCLAAHLAEQHGWRTSFLSPEDPAYRMRRDLMRFRQRNMTGTAEEKGRLSLEWIREHFVYTAIPEDEPVTMDTVLEEMEIAVLQHNCQAFVLDPWNEVSYTPSGDGETKDIERLLVRLKQKMRRLNLLLIIVAHPRKPQKDEEITLYTISGSANWFNKCDHGIVLDRWEQDSNRVKITIGKSKDHETMGKPGACMAALDEDKFVYVPDSWPTEEEYEARKQRRKRGRDMAAAAQAAEAAALMNEPPIMDGRYGGMV